jgi:hypothetical protein
MLAIRGLYIFVGDVICVKGGRDEAEYQEVRIYEGRTILPNEYFEHSLLIL